MNGLHKALHVFVFIIGTAMAIVFLWQATGGLKFIKDLATTQPTATATSIYPQGRPTNE